MRWRFWRRADAERCVRKDVVIGDSKEFEVGMRFRNQEGFEVTIGGIIGVHEFEEGVVSNSGRVVTRSESIGGGVWFGEDDGGYFEERGVGWYAGCG